MDSLSGIKLGDVHSALVVARQCHIMPDEFADKLSSRYSSLELIAVLKDLTRSREEFYRINKNIHERLLDQESADFTRPDVLDQRVAQLTKLLEYFSDVIVNTGKLIGRLQKQSIDSTPSLKLNANCQRQFAELLAIIAKMINNHSQYLRSLQHTREKFNFKNDLTKISKFSEMVQVLMECKDLSQTLQHHFQLQSLN